MTNAIRMTAMALTMTSIAQLAHAVGPTTDLFTPSQAQSQAVAPAAPQQSSPAIAFGSPVGFGLNFGQVAAGIGGQTLPKGVANDRVDGSMGLAAGFGNSASAIGFEVTANIISLRDNFAQDGSFNAKLHRMLNPTTSVSVGAESFGGWGAARDARISSYAAITHVHNVGVPVVINGGFGTDRFRSTGPTSSVGAFGSIAVVPHPRLSLILDYTGIDTNAGVSVVPFTQLPVTLTVGYVNLSENQGLTREFAGGLGYLYRY